MSGFRLGGLIAAPYTPFDSSGSIKLDVIKGYADLLVCSGVKGTFVCGTTGEGPSLTTDERMAVAKRWVEVSRGQLKIVVHAGHCCQRDAIELARHARQIGAAAIGLIPPFFFKPATPREAVAFCEPVAEAGGDLPFYYYHIPSMTGVTLPMVPLMELAARQIPTFNGIKFTHGDLMEFQRCRAFADGAFDIAWGFDEMLLGALAVGADAAVGSTYNYAAPIYVRMIDAFRAGRMDEARSCSKQAVELVAVLFKYGVLRTGKAIMSMIGVDCGPTRAPISPLSYEELAAVRKACDELAILKLHTR
jgi:N-acetylneuraminate lyase